MITLHGNMKLLAAAIIVLAFFLTFAFAGHPQRSLDVAKRAVSEEQSGSGWSGSRERSDASSSDSSGGSEGAVKSTYDVNKDQLLSMMRELITTTKTVPIIGKWLAGGLSRVYELLLSFEKMTNGLANKLLSLVEPCTVSLDEGIRCKGIASHGGISKIVQDFPKWLRSLVLPRLLTTLTGYSLGAMLNPIDSFAEISN